MKLILQLAFLFWSFCSFGQLLNTNFEEWVLVNGVESPKYWKTNNVPSSVSVSKTTDSFSGNFALQIINNGPSIEGLTSGSTFKFFSTTDSITKISAYVKCDTLSGSGKGVIKLDAYLRGFNVEIGRYEIINLTNGYQLAEIITQPLNRYDSIRVSIMAQSIINAVGWPTGFVKFKVDEIKLSKQKFNTNVDNNLSTVFPNPSFGSFQVNISSRYAAQSLNLRITNVLSQTIHFSEITTLQFEVNLVTYCSSGTYFLLLSNKDNKLLETKKLVVY